MNGQSLERVTHEQAVSILKNATSPVELVLSQSSYNVSSFGECHFYKNSVVFSKIVGMLIQ